MLSSYFQFIFAFEIQLWFKSHLCDPLWEQLFSLSSSYVQFPQRLQIVAFILLDNVGPS